MSTRSGVIIKKNNETRQCMYHHCDGYPEGVGADLDEYLQDMFAKAINGMDLTVQQIASDLYMGYCGYGDDSYHRVDNLDWRMEYVYVIDLDELTITCYSTFGHYGDDLNKQLVDENIVTTYKPEANNIKNIKVMKEKALELKEQLMNHVVRFTYKKVNGDLREAEGTTNLVNVPVEQHPNADGNYTSPEGVQRYYDTQSKGWRSFKVENLVSIDEVID